jgi:hypothetical protein
VSTCVLAVAGEGGSVLVTLGAFYAHAGHVCPAVAEELVSGVLVELATLRVCCAVLPDWRGRGGSGGRCDVARRRAASAAVGAPVAVAVLGTAIPPLERVARLWERALAVAPRIGCGSGRHHICGCVAEEEGEEGGGEVHGDEVHRGR